MPPHFVMLHIGWIHHTIDGQRGGRGQRAVSTAKFEPLQYAADLGLLFGVRLTANCAEQLRAIKKRTDLFPCPSLGNGK